MNQEKIGKFIAEKRKEKKLTQDQLAEKLSISKNAVSKWERGLNLPDVSIMQDLCKILNITLNELFVGEKILDEKYKEVADNNLLNVLVYSKSYEFCNICKGYISIFILYLLTSNGIRY